MRRVRRTVEYAVEESQQGHFRDRRVRARLDDALAQPTRALLCPVEHDKHACFEQQSDVRFGKLTLLGEALRHWVRDVASHPCQQAHIAVRRPARSGPELFERRRGEDKEVAARVGFELEAAHW